jgi:hypothetical protein
MFFSPFAVLLDALPTNSQAKQFLMVIVLWTKCPNQFKRARAESRFDHVNLTLFALIYRRLE